MRFRELRWPCDHQIGIRGSKRVVQARVVNLSSLGARILVEGVERGDTVQLDLSPGWIGATVRWVRDGMAGLRFAQPMAARDMARIRGNPCGPASRPKWNLSLQELR